MKTLRYIVPILILAGAGEGEETARKKDFIGQTNPASTSNAAPGVTFPPGAVV